MVLMLDWFCWLWLLHDHKLMQQPVFLPSSASQAVYAFSTPTTAFLCSPGSKQQHKIVDIQNDIFVFWVPVCFDSALHPKVRVRLWWNEAKYPLQIQGKEILIYLLLDCKLYKALPMIALLPLYSGPNWLSCPKLFLVWSWTAYLVTFLYPFLFRSFFVPLDLSPEMFLFLLFWELLDSPLSWTNTAGTSGRHGAFWDCRAQLTLWIPIWGQWFL